MPVVYVASKARNAAAVANSSTVPYRFMGLLAVRSALNRSAASSDRFIVSRIPESMGPGLIALTRIPRGSSSPEKVRAIERSAALPAA